MILVIEIYVTSQYPCFVHGDWIQSLEPAAA